MPLWRRRVFGTLNRISVLPRIPAYTWLDIHAMAKRLVSAVSRAASSCSLAGVPCVGITVPAYFFRSEPEAAALRRLARRESDLTRWSSITPAFSHLRIRGALADNVRRFVDDSPLEGDGFEPS